MLRVVVVLGILLGLSPGLGAQEADRTIRLTVSPVPESVPALKHSLLPEVRDQIAGNAVQHYCLAILTYRNRAPDVATTEKLEKWSKTVPKDLPRDELRAVLQGHNNVFTEIELGARCRHCDWEMTERLRRDGVGTSMTEIQYARDMARLLRLRVRLEVADGRFDQAARTLRTGFALARHVGEAPTLICALVGMAIAQGMAEEMETLVQQPKAPNFYWPLSSLPSPFIGTQRAFQGERLFVEHLFPMRELARQGPLSSQQLQEVQQRLTKMLPLIEGVSARDGAAAWQAKLFLLVGAAKAYPDARKRLLAQGRKAADLDAMPLVQVVLLDAFDEYDRAYDEVLKWVNLPYPQARLGLRRTEKALFQASVADAGMEHSLARMLLPASVRVQDSTARLERRLAALRCIEALRLHVAAHAGKLPEKLDAITDVPVPLDPMTGKAFTYAVEGDKVTLRGLPPAGEAVHPANDLHYELRFARDR